jgi:hypothetical protein
MQYRQSYNMQGGGQNPFNSLISLLLFVGVLVLLFFLAKGLFSILYIVSPVLLIITLIINYRVVANYIISVFQTFQTDVLMGALKVLFTVLCFPLVIGWLFAKSLIYRKVDKLRKEFESQMNQHQQGAPIGEQYVDYEEIPTDPDAKPKDEIKIIELPKPKNKEKNNPYDNLFE